MTTLDSSEFDALFDGFTSTAFRMETLPSYDVGEDEDYAAWRELRPRPQFSVVTSPWAARMARTSTAGQRWSRVRLIGTEPTEYERWELGAYLQSAVLGEEIRILERSHQLAAELYDYWLFDADKSGSVVRMVYDAAGRPGLHELIKDAAVVRRCRVLQESAWQASTPLNDYLAAHSI